MLLITAFILMVATYSVANAQDAPQAGYILGGAHSEFGVSSHMLYVTYPGVKDTSASFVIRCKEYKENNDGEEAGGDDDDAYTDIHTYHLNTEDEAKKPYTYFFALRNTKKGNYTVKICKSDGTCSRPSSPATVIDDGQGKLDCKEFDKDVKDISIPSITKYATGEELTEYKQKMPRSIATKQDITENPSYKKVETQEGGEEKGFMYFLVKYQLGAFKKLFTVSSDKDEDKYCQRKHIFMVISQVIDKNTKRVLARGRFTPRPLTKEEHITKYITQETPEEVPIEFRLDVSKELAKRDDLEIWHSICISAKDMVATREKGFAVKCSEPFESNWAPVTEE